MQEASFEVIKRRAIPGLAVSGAISSLSTALFHDNRWVVLGTVLLSIIGTVIFILIPLWRTKIPDTIELLSTSELYNKMRTDAKKASNLYLTSLQSGPYDGDGADERKNYFDTIDELIQNGKKHIARITLTQGINRRDEIERLLEISDVNFELYSFKYGQQRTYNVQIFEGISCYIIDPLYAVDNSNRDARHLRIVDTNVVKNFKDKYDDIASKSHAIKKNGHTDSAVLDRILHEADILEGIQARNDGHPLIYELTDTNQLWPKLVSVYLSDDELEGLNWRELARLIQPEESLISYEHANLLERCKKRQSAIAINGTSIISHVSVRPVFNKSICASIFNDDAFTLGDRVKVFEMATGWTRPGEGSESFRNRGISSALRRKLVGALPQSDRFFLSFCKARGASSILSNQMQWRLVGWDKHEYLSSLIGWFYDDKFYKLSIGELPTSGLTPWNGNHREYSDKLGPEFDQHFNLWAADTSPNGQITKYYEHSIRENVALYRRSKGLEDDETENLNWWRENLVAHFQERPDIVSNTYK